MCVDLFLRFVWLIVYFLRKASADWLLQNPVLLLFFSIEDLIWYYFFPPLCLLLIMIRATQFIFFRVESEHFNSPDKYNLLQGN